MRTNDKNWEDRHFCPLWGLQIEELTGHNIEVQGRGEVNKLLKEGWILLHIYTLRYQEDGLWRERPMAILGKPKIYNRKNNKFRLVEDFGKMADHTPI